MILSTNRSQVRKEFASFLEGRFVGPLLPVQAVYDYQVGDFQGKSPVVVVTSRNSNRGLASVGNSTTFVLEVHTFVLYAATPRIAENNPLAGLSVEILVSDTSPFLVGDDVTVDDDVHVETPEVTAIDPGVSITVDALSYNYTAPRLSVWTESQSEDMVDLLEKMVADAVVDANDEDTWLEVNPFGESDIDVVEIGGNPFRHETIPVSFTVQDFRI